MTNGAWRSTALSNERNASSFSPRPEWTTSMGRGDAAKGTVDGDTWTFDGESKMGDTLIKTRYTIKLPSPDSAVMRSEVSMEGGPMTLLMELKGSRVKQSSSNFSSRKLASTIGQPRRT